MNECMHILLYLCTNSEYIAVSAWRGASFHQSSGCGACALLKRRHVASSRAPPQKNIIIISRCPHPLRIPLKITAAPFFPYFQA
jgi:hypothetical protein